ncbi:hypothetical protein GGP84_002967 [Salinibacter ruber]|nr:hypothetical protein [Salinibacter ruber]
MVGLQDVLLAPGVSTVALKPCVCEQRGVCPQNPDGECACDHHGEQGYHEPACRGRIQHSTEDP